MIEEQPSCSDFLAVLVYERDLLKPHFLAGCWKKRLTGPKLLQLVRRLDSAF